MEFLLILLSFLWVYVCWDFTGDRKGHCRWGCLGFGVNRILRSWPIAVIEECRLPILYIDYLVVILLIFLLLRLIFLASYWLQFHFVFLLECEHSLAVSLAVTCLLWKLFILSFKPSDQSANLRACLWSCIPPIVIKNHISFYEFLIWIHKFIQSLFFNRHEIR